jgi:2-oxoglutarate ferredoxin oxidoreductase subunit delta
MQEQAARKKIGKVTINADFCKECSFCIQACTRAKIVLSKKVNIRGYYPAIFIDDGGCNACGLCAIICPEAAVEVEYE